MSLCPFKWLVSTFLRQCGQSFKRLIARIPRQWGLRLALGGMSGVIASRTARSISRMVEGGWSLAFAFGVDCLIEQPTPVAELSTTLFHLGYDRWLEPFAKKIGWEQTFLGLRQHQTLWGPLEDVWAETPSPVLPLVGIESCAEPYSRWYPQSPGSLTYKPQNQAHGQQLFVHAEKHLIRKFEQHKHRPLQEFFAEAGLNSTLTSSLARYLQ